MNLVAWSKTVYFPPCETIKYQIKSFVFWCSYRWTCCFARSDSSPVLSLVSIFRGLVVTSRYHGSKISGYQQNVVLQICQKTRKKKWRGWLSCARLHFEQNGSPYVSSTVRQRRWPPLQRKIVEIQKLCFHGDVTSHFSPLLSSGGKR